MSGDCSYDNLYVSLTAKPQIVKISHIQNNLPRFLKSQKKIEITIKLALKADLHVSAIML
jgi:hypothetical protein